MLETIAIILIVLWLLGIVSGYTMGNFIYVLLVVSLALGEAAHLRFAPRSAGALIYLTLVGAIGGFSAYAYALKHLPVATVSLYAYVNPIIAVLLGTLVLQESFSPRIGIAALVVLAGSALVKTGDG